MAAAVLSSTFPMFQNFGNNLRPATASPGIPSLVPNTTLAPARDCIFPSLGHEIDGTGGYGDRKRKQPTFSERPCGHAVEVLDARIVAGKRCE